MSASRQIKTGEKRRRRRRRWLALNKFARTRVNLRVYDAARDSRRGNSSPRRRDVSLMPELSATERVPVDFPAFSRRPAGDFHSVNARQTWNPATRNPEGSAGTLTREARINADGSWRALGNRGWSNRPTESRTLVGIKCRLATLHLSIARAFLRRAPAT